MAAWEIRLVEPLRLSEAGEAALEDYAREVTGAREAEAVRDEPGAAAVAGVRLVGLGALPPAEAQEDVRAFARELAQADDAARLGWS